MKANDFVVVALVELSHVPCNEQLSENTCIGYVITYVAYWEKSVQDAYNIRKAVAHFLAADQLAELS